VQAWDIRRDFATTLTARVATGQLAKLGTLDLSSDPSLGPLLLSPLGAATCLTSLRLTGLFHEAGEAWLPSSLRRLRLYTPPDEGAGMCETSWLDSVVACTRLEALQLIGLCGRGLSMDPGEGLNVQENGDGLQKFYSVLAQVGHQAHRGVGYAAIA
jgi:hypothetical protein